MPLEIPNLDDRRYPELLEEALARIPVHNPEWINLTPSDPGVTLVQLFAFMTENLLYRANQIPERNRKKFLSLLGIGLKPAASARGLLAFANERGPLETQTLDEGLEVRAGQVPFRLERGLDVLPIEAQVYYKRWVKNPDPDLLAASKQLYKSFLEGEAADLKLYQTTPLDPKAGTPVDLKADTVDGYLWIALLARKGDSLEPARQAVAGRTLNLGLAPVLDVPQRDLLPGEAARPSADLLRLEQPLGQPGAYRRMEILPLGDVLREPGVIEVSLGGPESLMVWEDLDPLEAGVGELPPDLEDTNQAARVITWLRLAAPVRLAWAGVNAAMVRQEDWVLGEPLPDGSGEPDQEAVLSRRPVLPGTVRLRVSVGNSPEEWSEIPDLYQAGPEVPAPDLRDPPSFPPHTPRPSRVFVLDPESGRIRFGDGARGARPPKGAKLRADYRYGLGQKGNVAAGTLKSSPDLPAGFSVSNPVRTWGGADAQSLAEAEKGIPAYLRHRDRLVSATDFAQITRETPGVSVGRVEVLPAYHPALVPNVPGGAPGAVTLMLIPRSDPLHPEAPEPDAPFLDAICRYLEPRRLITTELYLRPPQYQDLYLSLGIQVLSGYSPATVRQAVKAALRRFLSPLPDPARDDPFEPTTLSLDPTSPRWAWPLNKSVQGLELLSVASRVEGVQFIDPGKLLLGTASQTGDVPLEGLQLPRIAALSVSLGDPVPLADLRGQGSAQPGTPSLPVPVIPQECK